VDPVSKVRGGDFNNIC